MFALYAAAVSENMSLIQIREQLIEIVNRAECGSDCEAHCECHDDNCKCVCPCDHHEHAECENHKQPVFSRACKFITITSLATLLMLVALFI